MDGEVVFFANLYYFEDNSKLERADCNEDYIAAVVVGSRFDDEIQNKVDVYHKKVFFMYAPKNRDDKNKCPYFTKFARPMLEKLSGKRSVFFFKVSALTILFFRISSFDLIEHLH